MKRMSSGISSEQFVAYREFLVIPHLEHMVSEAYSSAGVAAR